MTQTRNLQLLFPLTEWLVATGSHMCLEADLSTAVPELVSGL